MMIKRELIIKNENETREFGLKLAEELRAGDVLALIGDLGTGKTALTGYIAQGLGISDNIVSPTFTIVREYTDGRLPLYHFDVYRLADSEEMFNIGAEEYFYEKGGVCVIEWADIVEDILPADTKYIYIEYGATEGERIYKCTF
ncbi:MAG: tRNA (adenosine(37)-N6)-threonylcarbamoyltransferase complex ATPase subunit type 1 TsaE [Anaerovoracaceae bacterium]|nr:tRNA (adenosine(37)-N6)-threonylcarbamoyltransferase complex ATPase subunit type 1 TsaE [Anaerovoracaceae bacterium]